MDRMQADGLVRRAERQGNAFLQSILVGYVLGFVAMLALGGVLYTVGAYSVRHKKIAPCPIAPYKLVVGII